MKRPTWKALMTRNPAFFALILLIFSVIINFILQPNLFASDTLNSNMRVFLPLILLSVGQAVVILGGGIDISVGAIVSIVNTILATRVGLEGSPEAMWQYVGISLAAGILAGAINGFFVAYLRLQPIITTYATSFLYAGFALFILPNPGGGIPATIAHLYRNTSPLGLPLAFYVIAIVLGLWGYIRSTRYGNYLFAVGGKAQAAYETAVPVAMTLNSITAVVIGGTALSGGVGSVGGAVMGAITLGIIQNIVSFAKINTWWETLVKASIIVVALATPGLINLFRRRE